MAIRGAVVVVASPVIGRLDETVSITECPSCGANSWDYGFETVVMPQRAPNPDGAGLELLPMICNRCAYTRLHSAHHLENPS